MKSSVREAKYNHRIVRLTKGFMPIYSVDFISNERIMKTQQQRQRPIVDAISHRTSSYPLIPGRIHPDFRQLPQIPSLEDSLNNGTKTKKGPIFLYLENFSL